MARVLRIPLSDIVRVSCGLCGTVRSHGRPIPGHVLTRRNPYGCNPCILVLMVVAASCLYEAFVYMAVKQKSTFVGRKTKEKVLAMSRKTRQGKAVLFIVLAVVCFVLMVVAGMLMAHAGYNV